MKYLRSILFSLFLVVGFAPLFAMGSNEAGQKKIAQIDDQKLVVYCAKSFVKYGPGEKIAELFKAKEGIDVEFVLCKEGILKTAIIEGNSTRADVLVGIDNHTSEVAKKAKILQSYHPKKAEKLIDSQMLISKDWLLTPFDFGYLAFMFDTKSNINPPKKLDDLIKPEYKGKLVIYDPRMSTTGLGFIAWINSVYGDKASEFLEKLRPNIFAMTPTWSDGYTLFTNGEAPLAFSYTSSMPYHILWDKTDRFQALVFEDGHIVQIEGMGISAYSQRIKNAQKFIDFMLTQEVQELIPEGNFMYPAVKNTKLPESYKTVPQPTKVLKIPTQDNTKMMNEAIDALQK